MDLKSPRELETTRMKLARLEKRVQILQSETGGDEELRELSMESLSRLINQLKEENARYEARHSVAR